MHTLIIDDEKHCRDSLFIMLSKYCPAITVVDQCPDVRTALKSIQQYQPDLLFLDIEMPGMNGFELLKNCPDSDFKVIFVTAYNEYAIQAIRHSALDYLLKPVINEELIQAVDKAVQVGQQHLSAAKVTRLLQSLQQRTPQRIALPTVDGIMIVDLQDILYCESENNYTRLYLTNDKMIFVAKTLKKIETLLSVDPDFFRIHHSFIVNMRFVRQYLKGDGGMVVLANGKNVPISRVKRQELFSRLERL